MTRQLRVGILVFDDVEVLDFAGPLIGMAFTVVRAFCGREVADETARHIEYPFWAG